MTHRAVAARRFATTRWSLIHAAGASTPDARDALADLCALYWYPAFAFVRKSGAGAEDAADVVQDFFTSLLARDEWSSLSQERGRFRSWLLASLRHYQANRRDKERAQKRGGGVLPVSIDARDAEDRYLHEPAHDDTPEQLFLRRWALAMIDASLRALRDECAEAGADKARLFDALKPSLTGDGDDGDYARIAAALAMPSANAVKQAAHRLRRRWRELFRAHVAETLPEGGDVDDEIRLLMAALA